MHLSNWVMKFLRIEGHGRYFFNLIEVMACMYVAEQLSEEYCIDHDVVLSDIYQHMNDNTSENLEEYLLYWLERNVDYYEEITKDVEIIS